MIGPLPYVGGKRRVANRLLTLIPPHETYVEPFAGGAQLFFHKPRSRVEVLNDVDGQVVNFLRVLQRHPHELARVLRWQPASRKLFDEHLTGRAYLTDVEQAAQFFFLQKNAFGGRRHRRHFHVAIVKPNNYQPARLPDSLVRAADRLAEVQLESSSYEAVLDRYDRPTTFFYLDPPYVDVDHYAHNFTDDQFAALSARLAGLRGRFLLSINDVPKAHEWFAAFHKADIHFTYTALRQPRSFRELLFANFPIRSP